MEHFLHAFFAPKSIALFGASERTASIGEVAYKNLQDETFNGHIYPINPAHNKVFGEHCFNTIFEIDNSVDLALIATPVKYVNQIMEDCGKFGVKAAIILSDGFGETRALGAKLEQEVQNTARRFGIRFIGPNCLGVMRPSSGLNATFNNGSAIDGNLALISQSGALCSSILDWAKSRKLGFSSVVSIGATADVHFGEILDYLIYDHKTKSILLYIEEIDHARSFISALKAASRVKPILVMKVGRHHTSPQMANTRAGDILSQDNVFNAALRQAGAVRGYKVNDLFVAATVLSKDKRLKGENLAVITNGGSLGSIAADRASDFDIHLSSLSEQTNNALSECLPANWSQANPIDILGDATPERYKKALEMCLNDKTINGIIIILTPQVMTNPLDVASYIVKAAQSTDRVLIACFMGGELVSSARNLLEENNIPTFQTPEAAIEAFSYLRNFAINQKLLLQVPDPLQKKNHRYSDEPQNIIENALLQGRDRLTKLESMAILNAYGISIPKVKIATDENEATKQAELIGYPIVMKVCSKAVSDNVDIAEASGLINAAAVKSAYREIAKKFEKQLPKTNPIGVSLENICPLKKGREVVIELTTDPVFGPVISIGAGGVAAEIVRDREVAIPPLNKTLVAELISRTKILTPFFEEDPCNLLAIEQILLSVSQIACELPWIKELNINPVRVEGQNAIALDARIIVQHYEKVARYDHMAIHPYPSELVKNEVLHSGETLTIRPIRPEDAKIEKEFVDGLSLESKYFRFMQGMRTLQQSMLVRFTQIDYDLEMALIAVIEKDGNEQEIGVARYVTNIDKKSCEFAIVVADDWHRRGIAKRLMLALITCATEKGLKEMQGTVLAENKPMLDFCKGLNFKIEYSREDKGLYNVFKHLH